MESWDNEDFEPKVVTPAPIVSNKWEGEDEEDEVKESWEDEEEEEQQKQQQQLQQQQQQQQQQEDVESPPKMKKKNLQEKIAEKERLKREEHERRLKEQPEEEIPLEEQLRRQKESDIIFALETTFEGSNSSSTTAGMDAINPNTIDSMNPDTKEEFQEFSEAITSKLQQLTKNIEFPNFAEDLIRNICVTLTSGDLKKIKTTIENLYQEKQKIEKGDKARKSKGKGKAKLKLDNENQYSAYVDDYNEFDDFM